MKKTSEAAAFGSPPPIPKKDISSLRLWYAAVVPLLGLFIETYAVNIYTGALVWVCAVLGWTAACLLDRRYIADKGVDVSGINPFAALFPPLYIGKRAKLTYEHRTTSLVFLGMLAYAVVFNGFTTGLTMTENRMISRVRDNYWQNVSGFDENKDASYLGLIGDTLGDMEGKYEAVEWSGRKSGGTVSVDAVAEKCGMEFEFEMSFDGYSFGTIEVKRIVTKSGEFEGDKAREQLEKILSKQAKAKRKKK